MLSNPQQFYQQFGILSDPGKHQNALSAFPDDFASICSTLNKIFLHIHWASRMGVMLDEQRQAEVNIRSFERMMDRLLELESSPITTPRDITKRIVGNCRDISLLLSTILKNKGIPARSRCGFATYFTKGHYEDHWVCEYWHTAKKKWVMVDAQLNDFQQTELNIDFNPYDVPSTHFITAGRAWQMIRQNKADPNKFGIFKYRGEMFIAGNLQRDLLALNNIELLPWDLWGYLHKRYIQLTKADLKLLDEIAIITQLGDTGFPLVRQLYKDNKQFHPKEIWLK